MKIFWVLFPGTIGLIRRLNIFLSMHFKYTYTAFFVGANNIQFFRSAFTIFRFQRKWKDFRGLLFILSKRLFYFLKLKNSSVIILKWVMCSKCTEVANFNRFKLFEKLLWPTYWDIGILILCWIYSIQDFKLYAIIKVDFQKYLKN